jgi:Transglycosylase SLT domain
VRLDVFVKRKPFDVQRITSDVSRKTSNVLRSTMTSTLNSGSGYFVYKTMGEQFSLFGWRSEEAGIVPAISCLGHGMRINFNASFSELSRTLGVRAHVPPGAPAHPSGFAEELGKLAERDRQPIDFNHQNKARGDPKLGLPEEPLARFRIPLPDLHIEDPALQAAAPAQPETVNEAAKGVKKPTIVSARRVAAATLDDSLLRQYQDLVEVAGAKHKIDPALGMAVIATESAFDPKAISKDGHFTKGLFQLKDTTGQQYLDDQPGQNEEYDPFDPQLNIELGIGHLRYLHDIFSKEVVLSNNVPTAPAANSTSLEKLAVAAFNAGEGRVASAQYRAKRHGADPTQYDAIAPYLPESTRNYVAKVLAHKLQFEVPSAG